MNIPGQQIQPYPRETAAAGHVENHEIDLREILELVRAARWLVVAITILVVIIASLYCFLAAPGYQADGLVQVEENSSGKGGGGASELGDISSLLVGNPVETQAEIQVLSSRMVLGPVIDKLNLEIEASPKLFPILGGAIFRAHRASVAPVEVAKFLRRYAWGGEQITVSTWNVPDSMLGRRFKLIKTEDGFTVISPDGTLLLNGRIGEPVNITTSDGEFSIFVRNLVAQPGTVFNLLRHSRQEALSSIGNKLGVTEQGKQSGVIRLSFEDHSAQLVAAVLNTIEDTYLLKNVERRSANAQQSLEFLQRQLPKLEEKVETAQANLKAYQSSHGSADVSQETELVLKHSVDLEAQRLTLEQQKEEALQRFTAEHPTVKALDQQINSLQSAQAKVKQQTGNLPTTQQEILTLKRDLDVSTELYTQMLNSIQELQVAKAGTVGNVRIVDPALRPLRPTKPKVATIMIVSVFAGLFLGCVGAFLQRALLRGVDDPAEVEAQFGLTTYAMIPYSDRQKDMTRFVKRGLAGAHLLALQHSDDIAVEALKSLRTSLHFAMLEASNNVIMLTGPSPGLGKSFVSINLATVLALGHKKVLLIDADMRRGHLNKYLSDSASPGISDFVVGTADLNSIVRPTSVKGLDLIYRGTIPPNPSELLLHERFSSLVSTMSERYEYVLIDTPPVLAVTDAAIVGKFAGCTLLVLKSAEHPIREIEEVLKRLATAGIIPKGALFNQVGARGGSRGYGSYGYTNYRYSANS